jgi:hypothetical protein
MLLLEASLPDNIVDERRFLLHEVQAGLGQLRGKLVGHRDGPVRLPQICQRVNPLEEQQSCYTVLQIRADASP